MRTGVKVTAFLPANREGEIVTTRFALDPKVSTSAPPFRSVRRDPAPTGASLGQEVRQFVAQCAIDFRFAVRGKTAIEEDTRGAGLSTAGGGPEAR